MSLMLIRGISFSTHFHLVSEIRQNPPQGSMPSVPLLLPALRLRRLYGSGSFIICKDSYGLSQNI